MSLVVVAGALANKPGKGGEAWVRLSWIRGFQRLGLEVIFVEQLGDRPGERDPRISWFEDVMRRFGLHERATLLAGEETVIGASLAELEAMAPEATLVNISGHLTQPRLFGAFRSRVMVDIDPGFTQLWHHAGLPGANVDGHDLHFTIGELIGTPECRIPIGAVDWRAARQPVLLEDWPVTESPETDRFTTVASWRGPFGPIAYDGRTYGLKVHEFRKFLDLPRRSAHHFEIALDIDPADAVDRERLRDNRWRIADPDAVARHPDVFRSYIQGSGAEFSVAQGIYVDTSCGWFSDRTTRYLASGKPVLVQDTGFSRLLPVGRGLVCFRTVEQAVRGASDIVARYPEHAAAARRIAEEYFAADRVLARFCDQAGIS